ncbi:redoxin domain-containing protein [Ferruginibacter lapsinanis]|uniref:TlpA family protein disulfide reductase n=1 Tax=Ferruginibacter lapsinanis TaxID=563172 RepID=UPI001E2A76E0|nr:redoxin domain-containing protein [Ferruginibacter lapsinanis]UEG48968.1 redoxin domain-containing protein [Ferruginibacter lapsinanis]
MKKIFLIIALFACSKMLFAQADTSLLYLKFTQIPPFSFTKVPDSTKFAKADLKKRKATLIMAFSPDCEHCKHETSELIAHIKRFKKIQIVMASPLDYKYLYSFYQNYQLSKYPNITVARDPSWFLGTFYNIRNFPALFLYDKKGQFVKAFDGSVPVEKIAEAL